MTEENYHYRTNPMFLRNQFEGEGDWKIPYIKKTDLELSFSEDLRLIGFDKAKTGRDEHYNRIVHFFLYDYKFEDIWEKPDRYIEILKQYRAVLTPDYSMYTDMNPTIQLYNTFRNRWVGAYLAEKGIKVIPTVSWGLENTFDFCFNGIEKGSIVAVSTYMVSEHGNHRDQKEFFMKGYNEMLKRLEPELIICYNTPFPEMRGNILFVDYDLSSWRHYSDDLDKCFVKTKTYFYNNKFLISADKGMGDSHGGKWKPKKEDDERFLGKPGEIKKTFDTNGGLRLTKIGDDGRATMERHFSDHRTPWRHTNPHDHKINWDPYKGNPLPQGPINYKDSVPEFKYYIGDDGFMTKEIKHTIITKRNSFEDNRFKTISEFKWCVNDGGEVEFEWKGDRYSITHPEGRILICAGGYEKEGKYYNMNTDAEYSFDDEMWADNADEILDFNVNGDKLRDVITQVKVWSRSI